MQGKVPRISRIVIPYPSMNIKNLIYALTCLSFSLILGGAAFEHVTIIPIMSMAPPRSLAMFQGDFGLHPESFWSIVHPVTVLLFLATLILNWKSAARRSVLISFAGYIVILAISAVYFIPEVKAIMGTTYSDTVDPILTKRTDLWEMLSLARLGIAILLSLILFLGLTKSADSTPRQSKGQPH